MNRRYAASTAFAATLTAFAILTPGDAHPATRPITSGTGWTLTKPVTHIDTKPWTIGFHDTKSRTKLTPYLKKTAAELTTRLGVKITVSSRIIPARRYTCGPTHTITFRYMSKPNPAKPNESFAGGCNVRGRADSGYAFINSDYWAKGRRISEAQRMNLIWHETAHTIGLHHPAKCPKDKKTGRKPIMCDVNSYRSLSSRRYTAFENEAFKQLRANRARVAR